MNYIGSKLSLLNFLDDSISSVININKEKIVFCDGFAGTGIVGSYFKQKGYNIISNDIQYYSYVLNKSFQEATNKVRTEFFDYLNKLPLIETGFIYNNFCFGSGSNRMYFSDFNGKKIDTIRIGINDLYNNGKISTEEYYFYLASLIESADKCANTASVYGAFLKKLKKTAIKEIDFKPLNIISGNKGIVFNEDINNLVHEIEGDILYLDPPYNHRQYSSNYHLLETLSLYDNPKLNGKTGIRADSIKSKYCSKQYVKKELESLIKNCKFKYIFLSYNNEGLISISDIEGIFKKYGEYKIFTKEYKRFKADKDENRNIISSKTVEYLHCLKKEA